MRRLSLLMTSLCGFMVWIASATTSIDADDAGPVATEVASVAAAPAKTIEEARARAQLLHETIHGALQVMHRDFFREDEGLKIPSRSLEDVFAELADSYGVGVRWLAVDTEAMDISHKPQDDFEKSAVEALSGEDLEYEAIENGQYRYAGRIKLASDCLKCHVQSRTDTRDRKAGLVITLPLKPE